VRRRTLLLSAATVATGRARAADPALVALVFPGSPPAHAHMVEAFRRGLVQAGRLEGRDVVLALHYLDGDYARLPALAEAIVASRPRVIVAAPSPTVAGLRRVTTTIPIVMATGADPVGSGLAASLARPGGNVTGLSNQSIDLVEKQLGLLPELLPRAKRVLGQRGDVAVTGFGERMEASFRAAAARFGLEVEVVLLDERRELDRLRTAIAGFRPDALFVFADPIAFARRQAIAEIAGETRLPVVATFREFVELGALASYGASLTWSWQRTASFVERILRGADPAEMPIEQPTAFELVVNLRAARALGVEVPPLVLARADEVIE
jgi:putative ABC transport system substrate-binding protein